MRRKTKVSMSAWNLYGSLAVLLASAYQYLYGEEGHVFPKELWLGAVIIMLSISVLMLFFVFLSWVTISDKGLYIRGIGLVKWPEIEEIDLVSRSGISLLGVRTNVSSEIDARKTWWYRILTKSAGWPKRDFYLPLRGTSSTEAEIVKSILEYSDISGLPNKKLQPAASAPAE